MKFQKIILAVLISILMFGFFAYSEAKLPDGEYAADGFTWSGGSGRLKAITCDMIRMRDGIPYASITISSNKYIYVKVDGVQYDCVRDENSSTVEIPIKVNRTMTILACTTAMGSPHEIAYKLRVELDALRETSDTGIMLADTYFECVDSGEHITLFQSETVDLIESDGDYYYLTDDAASIPAGMEDEATIIVRPVSNAYLATDDAIDFACDSDAKGFRMVSEANQENVYLTENIANGSIIVVGKPDELDYKTLLVNGCDLAVIAEADAFGDTAEYLDMIGIPVYVDREDALREKAYALIFETEAE